MGGQVRISIKVNGTSYERDVEPRTFLVDFIREDVGLTGTNVGCDTSQCGACTVHMDGAAVKSCTVLAAQADGASVTTIEGLATGGALHPMQRAFTEKHGLQCGFCTPGMIMTAVKLVESHPHIEEDEIRHGLEGNLCRCTGYENIVRAVAEGSRLYEPHSPWETEQAEHRITLREAERRAAVRRQA